MRRARFPLCVLAASLLVGIAGAAPIAAQTPNSDEPAANPARPTVSTPATLTPVGYLQFETGMLGATDSPEFSSQYGLNQVTKIAIASRLEFFDSSQPFARSTVGVKSSNDAGDVSFGVQAVLFQGEGVRPTISVGYLGRAYNGAAPDLDFGSPSNSVVLLASADVKGFHYDTNALFNELESGAVRRAQFGQTLSISHPLSAKFALAGELWHFTQPFLHGHAVGNLWAVSYAARRTLVLDAGFDHGLTRTSTQWEAFAGFTYLLPHRLW
jgi:hypothetical protein